MKAYNHLFISIENFKNFIDGIELDRNKEVLLRIHTCIHSMEAIKPLVKEIKEILPKAVIIGCSTAGVICEGRILTDSCLISITSFDDCEMRLGMFSCETSDGKEKDGKTLSEEVSRELVKGDQGLMVVFFPLSYYKTAKFVENMNHLNEGLKMIGGAAYVADGVHHEAENYAYVLAQSEASANSMAAVMLTSPQLSVYENVVCGVESVGRSYEVTKVHEHFLDEIEDIDCAEWYGEMLGKEELVKDPSIVGIFPLVHEETQIAYNVVYEPYDTLPEPWKSGKRDRINLFSEISAGMKFSLGYFNPQKIADQMNTVYQELKKEPVEALFVYDCLSRMWMLHDCAKWEVEQFYTTNMSGALLAGEISNIGGENIYANSTYIIAGLSEHKDARILLKGKSLKDVSALQHDNVQMINYLLMTGNKQLNNQLGDQRNKMKRAVFFDEVLGLDNQTKFLYDKDRKKLDKIAVYSLKNERIIRLFLGQNKFSNELKEIYKEVERTSISEKVHFYSYGDCSLLIAGEDAVEEESFLLYAKKVFEQLNGINRSEFVFSYEGVVVVGEEELLQKAEVALQYGNKNKLPFVNYSQMPEELLCVKEEMHMLQVLREALVQDGIVPYFQGIYDNRQKKITMYEALIRIKDGQGKIYYPNQFLPISKEYNLYESLSVSMVKKVMSMFLDRNIRVTINLNVRDIYDRDMIKMIFHYLKKASHPENFIFELVESEEVKDYQFIKQFADSIHEHGAKVAIDDFGSGFSNLLHIIQIDADILKIDGEIIKEVSHDPNCREFVSMISGWCSSKGKEVVGEFVENEDIQQVMEEIGITHSQGYYFSKPDKWENLK